MSNEKKNTSGPPAISAAPASSRPAATSGRMLPVLPIKSMVLYPHLLMPLAVGRPMSVAAAMAAAATEDKQIVIVTQRDPSVEEPKAADLYTIGTTAIIRKMSKADTGISLVVSGVERVAVSDVQMVDGAFRAHCVILPLPADDGEEIEALQQSVLELGQRVLNLAQPQAQTNIEEAFSQNPDPLWLAFLMGSIVGLDTAKQQALLECNTRLAALKLVHESLQHQIHVLELRQKIAKSAEGEMTKEQRNYYLRQQLRAIQEELGEKNPEKAELDELRKKLGETKLPEEAKKEAERQLQNLERMPAAAPDYQMTRSHLELLLDLPWDKSTQDAIDLVKAHQILDEDHYDLVDVKERILEYLAVMKLSPGSHGPILCFVGPPGVGKTSLGQSIARAVGRKFERMSLGGMHDEAELRGHRRTYIGSMPGRMIQALRRAGVNNPVLMLDEVDKIGHDFRGDPAAALLEILDPAQNSTFRDNYLDLPFDLSKVFFITTANALDTIPRPLLDRMEIIRLSGYTQEEKIAIARRYLIPRQLKAAGLTDAQLVLPDEILAPTISRYTREAGVRELERMIAKIMRKIARRVAEGETKQITVRPDDLSELLGIERFQPERARKLSPPGVATGLAWTETGGEVLYIEAALLPNSKEMRLTGSLGDVMKESATTAQSYIWSHAHELGIDPARFRDCGVHIHVPSGAVPKDGPSAGVAMATALTSLYLQVPVAHDTAMTGEITLSGLVLPVGGIKEKVLAAHRAGIRKIVLPKDNQKDLRELPENTRREISFTFAERLEDVLAATLPSVKPAMAAA